MLEVHWRRWALALALDKAGSNIAARIAMMAITTRSSIRVNARAVVRRGVLNAPLAASRHWTGAVRSPSWACQSRPTFVVVSMNSKVKTGRNGRHVVKTGDNLLKWARVSNWWTLMGGDFVAFKRLTGAGTVSASVDAAQNVLGLSS